jgi:hypothetical protein
MAEPLRKDEELTTADLAGRNARPELVRDSRTQEKGDYADTWDPSAENGNAGRDRADINQPTPLFAENEVGDYRSRWSNIQAGFVDEPRHAVEEADTLVAQLMKKLAEGFANERQRLEKHWDSGENVSTEDLRVALQRYRSFFDRLLRI